MRVNVAWKWKADDCPQQTGCSTCKSSPREAVSARLNPRTTKSGGMWFPQLPERTRLFRLFKTHQAWTQVFLAAPTVLGVIDTYGIELIHPMREGRSPQQIGRKGLSNHPHSIVFSSTVFS